MADDGVFEIIAGDQRPFFVVVLKDNIGEPDESIVDLTTAMGVAFSMRNQVDLASVFIGRSGTITDPVGGEATYEWGISDLTAGTFDINAKVTWSDGKAETFPGGPSGGSYWTVLVTPDIT